MFRTLFFASLLLFIQFASSATILQVPILDREPEFNGDLDQGAWKQAAAFFGFTELVSGKAAQAQTHLRLAVYQDSLYVGVGCMLRDGLLPVVRHLDRDGEIYFDDSIDLCLALPGKPGNEYYQMSVNAANVRYDAFQVDRRWDGKWESAVRKDADSFTIYYRIPFQDLGFTEIPSELCFNMARSVIAGGPEYTVFIRTNPHSYFGDAQQGARLRFSKSEPCLALRPGAEYYQGKLNIIADTPLLPESGFIDVVLKLLDLSGKVVAQQSCQNRFDSKSGECNFGEQPDGDYILEASLEKARVHHIPAYYGGGGSELSEEAKAGKFQPHTYVQHRWPVSINNKPEIHLQAKLTDGGRFLECRVIPKNLSLQPGSNQKYRFSILSETGEKHRVLSEYAFATSGENYRWDISELKERERYRLLCELGSENDCLLRQEVNFATPSKPVWQTEPPQYPQTQALPPWTPVQLDGLTARVWGRDYVFSETSPLPVQVRSQEIPLLAAPMRFVSGDQAQVWRLSQAAKKNDACIRFDWEGAIAGQNCKAWSEVYFDGAVRFEVVLPEKMSLAELALEIPYRSDLARFIHRAPVMFGGIFTTYKTPDKAEYHPIRENVYVLDDDVGLCWFDGMRFDWPLKHDQQAIGLLPKADSFVVRVNYIDHLVADSPERQFSFGLQAIPVRPMPEKEPAMRVCYVVKYGDENPHPHPAWRGTVDYLPHGNFQIEQGCIEFQMKADFEPQSHSEREFFFRATHGNYYVMDLAWNSQDGIYAEIYEYGTKVKIKSGLHPKPGIWHAIALNWGKEFELFVDGQKVASANYPGSLKIMPAMLKAGGCKVFLDALRISSQPRTSLSLSTHADVDQYTLLADNFEKQAFINGRRATVPDKISEEAECGYLMPDTRIGPGCEGFGILPLNQPLKSPIQGYAEMGVDTLIFHGMQPIGESTASLYVTDEVRFRSCVKAIKANGMRAVIYTSNSLSNNDRMWDTYADPWLIEPRGMPFIPPNRPKERSFQACPRSEFFTYFVYRIGKLLDTYDLDGIFFDGRSYATCNNRQHGCGVRNFEGVDVPERNIWSGRERQLLLYHTVKQRNAYAEAHKSGNWDAPVCYLWDAAWEGEQFMSTVRGNQKRLDICPLEAMRAQMNGLPYGLPTRFTAYNYAPFTPVENATLAFVHGTTSAMTYRLDEAHFLTPYWKVQDQFGANYHNFIPYWAKEPPIHAPENDLIKVSAHRRESALLLMIANFNEDQPPFTGTLQLNPAVATFKKPVARDAFSGISIPIQADGTLTVQNLKSFRQTWIWIEESK
jgi:hypothetical protein